MTEDEKDYFEERAAIMEFDGGLSREQAERAAMKLLERKRNGKQEKRHERPKI